MELEKMLKLIDAGFTADEIREVLKPVPESPPKADPEPETDPKSEPEKEEGDLEKLVRTMTQSINDLKTTLTAHAARTTETGAPSTETAEDILAELIRPTYKKERGA